jgi:hypothetical protein
VIDLRRAAEAAGVAVSQEEELVYLALAQRDRLHEAGHRDGASVQRAHRLGQVFDHGRVGVDEEALLVFDDLGQPRFESAE